VVLDMEEFGCSPRAAAEAGVFCAVTPVRVELVGLADVTVLCDVLGFEGPAMITISGSGDSETAKRLRVVETAGRDAVFCTWVTVAEPPRLLDVGLGGAEEGAVGFGRVRRAVEGPPAVDLAGCSVSRTALDDRALVG
jgi:hypothetical protein